MDTQTPYEEKEWLRRIAASDQKAFNELFTRYRDRIFAYLFKITKSRETSEEIVLDVFLKIWMGRTILEEIQNIEAFLFRVARNKAVDFLRLTQKSRLQQLELWDRIQGLAPCDQADFNTLLKETHASLERAVDQLSPQRKRVFQLSHEQGLSFEEISKRLNLSRYTVRNHLAASIQFIRAHLDTELGVIALVILLPPYTILFC